MVKIKRVILSVVTAILLFTAAPWGYATDQYPIVTKSKQLVMGVFPRRNLTNTIRMFTPLAEYLSKEMSRPMKLETTRNFSTFWDSVADGRYDLVHFNQYHYLKSRKISGYRVIAMNEEFGKSTIAAGIMVRKDSKIDSLKELRGKKIMFGGNRQAMVSFILATYLLRRAGLKSGDYWESFALNPPNAFLATYFRQADAGGVGYVVMRLPMIRKKINTEEMKMIAKSKPIAHLPWAVKNTMGIKERQKLQKIMTAMHKTDEGKSVLKKAGLTALHKAADKDYAPLTKIIFKVTGERL